MTNPSTYDEKFARVSSRRFQILREVGPAVHLVPSLRMNLREVPNLPEENPHPLQEDVARDTEEDAGSPPAPLLSLDVLSFGFM